MPDLSVAELIRAAERQALRAQGQTGPTDAIALAAGWLAVLQAARETAAALPVPGQTGVATAPEHYLTVRIGQMASQARLFNPPRGAPHPAMTQIAATLHQAATLLRRDAHAWAASDPQARQEAAAARVRIAKSVAALAHAIARDMQAYSRQLLHTQRTAPRRRPAAAATMSTDTRARWARMAQTQEQRALDYVTDHRVDAQLGRPAAAPAESSIGLLLATWSATSIRAVADPQVSSSDLERIGRTQAALLRTAAALTATALDRGELDATAGPHLLHRLDLAAARWHNSAGHWTWARTPDPHAGGTATMASGRAVFSALDAITRGEDGWLSPQQISQRLDGVPIVPLLRSITETSQVLADTYEHLPHELHAAGRLRARAATLLAITKQESARTAARSLTPNEDASLAALPVNLADVAANRLLPLTPTARSVLHTSSAELATAAHAAHEALLLSTPQSQPRSEPAGAHVPPGYPLTAHPADHPQNRPKPGPGITP